MQSSFVSSAPFYRRGAAYRRVLPAICRFVNLYERGIRTAAGSRCIGGGHHLAWRFSFFPSPPIASRF